MSLSLRKMSSILRTLAALHWLQGCSIGVGADEQEDGVMVPAIAEDGCDGGLVVTVAISPVLIGKVLVLLSAT